ncbi:hypothetical protein [Polymorphospora lycopeni]|uniref:Uncharacterized protein n=1 Tax=Polymorphospora lycopeni TaxID=3140240 RepID=A0ABV5CL98_9ACTN
MSHSRQIKVTKFSAPSRPDPGPLPSPDEKARIHGVVDRINDIATGILFDAARGHTRLPSSPSPSLGHGLPTERVTKAHTALLAATDGVLRSVVELHAPHGRVSECEGCDFDGYDAERPDWPCRTIELIAEQVGITLTAEADRA